MMSWFSRRNTYVSLSTTESEYIISSVSSFIVVWLQRLLARLFDKEIETTLIHYENQRCVNISKNLVFHDKLKHIEIKYHFI